MNDVKMLIGTSNPHKQKMLAGILGRAKVEFVTLYEVFESNVPDVNETGVTFQENAEIKACELSKLFDGYVVATDGGVSVPGLGDKWNGLYTRRFAGENATDEDRIRKLLAMAKDLQGDQRKIIWQEAVAVARNGKILTSATCNGSQGTLTETYDPAKYTRGMWVCSLWYVDAYGKHFFDLTSQERAENSVSWRRIERHLQYYFKAAMQPIEAPRLQ